MQGYQIYTSTHAACGMILPCSTIMALARQRMVDKDFLVVPGSPGRAGSLPLSISRRRRR